MTGGELFDRIVQLNYDPTELDVVIYMKQICEGVSYLHKNQILHLDLKVNFPQKHQKPKVSLAREHRLRKSRIALDQNHRFRPRPSLHSSPTASSELWHSRIRLPGSCKLQFRQVRNMLSSSLISNWPFLAMLVTCGAWEL